MSDDLTSRSPRRTESTLTRMSPFLLGIAGLPVEEVRKAKLLFIRNEITELKGMIREAKGSWPVLIMFGLIPLFWPFLWSAWTSFKSKVTTQSEQINNAIQTWKDDLGADASEFTRQLESIAGR